MPVLQTPLSPEQSLALANDTSDIGVAERNVSIARDAGATVIKMGLQLLTTKGVGPEGCSELVASYGMQWVADPKLVDIPKTIGNTLENYLALDHPPVGITIFTRAGIPTLKKAQELVGPRGIVLLGVTELTSNDNDEAEKYNRMPMRHIVWNEMRRAVDAGIGGIVCSGEEVGLANLALTRHLFSFVPGTRSKEAATHDQKRSVTQEEAILAGADMLVIGREVTEADDPVAAYDGILGRVAEAKKERDQRIRNRRS